jgi:hypothetical protein
MIEGVKTDHFSFSPIDFRRGSDILFQQFEFQKEVQYENNSSQTLRETGFADGNI